MGELEFRLLGPLERRAVRRRRGSPADDLRWVVTERRAEAELALGRHSELVGELEVGSACNPSASGSGPS